MRSEYRSLPKAYYHLCTDGWKGGLLFNHVSQFVYGMATIALVAIKFDVKIYAFELMPNHIHMVLSATGCECVRAFNYIKRRIARKLLVDGNTPLPDDYGFMLKKIEDRKAMQAELLYLARNAYEKGFCVPGGYLWGTGYLLFNQWADLISGPRVDELSARKVRSITESTTDLPGDWEIHPVVGVLPKNFVCLNKVREMFRSPKTYLTRMVKDYESFVHIANELGEEMEYSKAEADDIMYQLIKSEYPRKLFVELTAEEKGHLAVLMARKYQVPLPLVSASTHIPEQIVRQLLDSKDFGRKYLAK